METASGNALDKLRGFADPVLPEDEAVRLADLARRIRGDIVTMTTLAGSGHPGGSLSSADILTLLWTYANVKPDHVDDPGRDRIVVSHGHIAAAVYAVLGRLGYFRPEEAICGFRMSGSSFEGHVDPKVPGVEWASGNLGQGLSAACGFALSSKLTGVDYRVYCVMGDGEQQKGQVSEARRFASKYSLSNLTVIIDCNELQAMGPRDIIMPQDLTAEWKAAGWEVIETDGHSFPDIYAAVSRAVHDTERPTAILAKTTMGRGISFIEDDFEYHGKVLTQEECLAAIVELGCVREHLSLTRTCWTGSDSEREHVENRIKRGAARTYTAPTDCRTAFGNALADISVVNEDVPIAVFDCDLTASVKTDSFAALRPDGFVQCGIQEHSAATIAGAVSRSGVLSFFVDFGVFGLDETYNQHRMNDINDTSLKLICTHCGLDVGEDGKTHQCMDYIGLAANLYGSRLVIPADANQTDRAIRHVASEPGSFIVAVGRSRVPIITDESGAPLYGGKYEYHHGRADWVRRGDDGVIIAVGNMVHRAVAVSELLRSGGLRVGVLNLSCPLALDEEAVTAGASTGFVATYEDHNVRTGMGSLVGSYLMERGLNCRFVRFGAVRYGTSGTPEENYRLQHLDTKSVAESIRDRLRAVGN